MGFGSVVMVHLYRSTDTATAGNKSCLILSERSDFYMIDNLLMGGARCIMVIVSGIGHGDTSSNPGRD